MTASFALSLKGFRRPAVAAMAALLLLPSLTVQSLAQRGPDKIADVAETVIDAVVNISTSQRVEAANRPGSRRQERPGQNEGPGQSPQVPPGSPFEDFFKDFFENRRGGPGGPGGQGGQGQGENRTPRRASSLGSGFVIDPSGLVVTNNHVIAEAEEIHVVFNDGARIKAEVVGRDPKTDIALLQIKPDKPLKAVNFGDSDKVRLGEWVIAIGNPFSLGGSVSAGIVSARNRDIQSGPYDNYIQTDAAINRGNSGGPLFNLNGDVIGVNTAIISPSGGSIGIGFAVPSKVVMGVIEQLREFKEVRRGWLGVRIQQVTDDIAESLGLKQARGALIAGVDDKGPAKPAGIEAGDIVIKFDGRDIKEMRDLPRIVADTPVGREVEVIVLRKGKEEKKTVKLGRLEDAEKAKPASVQSDAKPDDKTVVKKALGLDLANISADLRKRFKIKDSVNGVVITGIDQNSAAAEKRLNAGDTIVEVAQEAVGTTDDFQKKVDKLKKDGRKLALLLVANPEGELRFVTLGLQ